MVDFFLQEYNSAMEVKKEAEKYKKKKQKKNLKIGGANNDNIPWKWTTNKPTDVQLVDYYKSCCDIETILKQHLYWSVGFNTRFKITYWVN